MMRLLAILVLLVCSGSVWSESRSYHVKQVEDGDTLIVLSGSGEVRVQFKGIDAPEDVPNPKFQRDKERTGLDQELIQLGQLATRYLRELIGNGEVLLEGDLQKKDRYGRVPMLVFGKDGESLNEAMISGGYAVVLEQYPLPAELKARWLQLEQEARANGAGIWSAPSRDAAEAWSGK